MSARCCGPAASAVVDPRFRVALWIALALNATMFAVEVGSALASESVALLADSVDFFGDAGNYAISLVVVSMAPSVRSRVAILKAACMGLFGLFVIGSAAWSLYLGLSPRAYTMGVVGTVALLANGGVAWMLYRFRVGDANMRSAWICSRNDAVGNVAVLLAALGVFGTGNALPDVVVAMAMGALSLWGAAVVLRQAVRELQAPPQPISRPSPVIVEVARRSR